MSNKPTYTAQQRAQLFAMSTRQNMHMLAKQTATAFPSTLTFTLPKARLLAGLYIHMVGPSDYSAMFHTNYVRRIQLDLNNGFAPFTVSGEELAMYNNLDLNPQDDVWLSPSNGVVNFKLPVTTNDRDPIGLILLQNDQTNVTLTIDFANDTPGPVAVSVMTETFSIPAVAEAMPDLSVLKLVNARTDSLPSVGQQVIKLSTGTIYRKIILALYDENGEYMTDADITSNIEIVFNQADVNYSISPEMLKVVNHKRMGRELPFYIFDFSNGGGTVNFGGTRDYIDTSALTEFWIRFNTSKVGKCKVVTETLARLS